MKYIALDIGNVICHADMSDFISDISSTFNISLSEASRFLKSFQQIHDLGLTTMESQLRVWFDCKSETTSQRLVNHWNSSVRANNSMVSMLLRLQLKGVKVALLSNIGVEHAEMMKTKLDRIYESSIKHFSCFVGARKPSMLYYQSFLLQYPEFKGCLYVDDLQENLNASVQFGFSPHLFTLESSNTFDKINEIEQLMLKMSET